MRRGWIMKARQKDTWMTSEQNTAHAQMRTLVHYATLAANGHNTQPWKFAIKENAIEIHPDYSRQLPVVDPNHRELWISLGCALENLLVAARASGYAAEVTYPDRSGFHSRSTDSRHPQEQPIVRRHSLRQNTRSEYDGRLLKTKTWISLQALPLEPGVALQFATNPTAMETFLEYVNQGNLAQYAEPAFVDELISWLRFNKKEVLSSLDGLYSRCSGNPEVPRWLGQMFVGGTKPQQQADADAKKLRSSPVAVVIASESDDKTSWVRTGQVYERLALKMTSLNIKSAFSTSPLKYPPCVGSSRAPWGWAVPCRNCWCALAMPRPMPKSLRRPVEQVLI
jgi:hypothetical protein